MRMPFAPARLCIVSGVVLIVWMGMAAAHPAQAQKGTGDSVGVAPSNALPTVVRTSGTVRRIDVAPCESTTGRAPMGVHLTVDTPDGPVNLHLGPVAAVDHVLDQLAEGQSITFDAFRTDALPPDARIAKTLQLDGKTIVLRDDRLRPAWAYGPGRETGSRPARGRCW